MGRKSRLACGVALWLTGACSLTGVAPGATLLDAGFGETARIELDGGSQAGHDAGSPDAGGADAGLPGTFDAGQGGLGQRCQQNSDCTAGGRPTCFVDSKGDGYCTAPCGNDAECPDGLCVSNLFTNQNGTPVSFCLADCVLGGCAEGSLCESVWTDSGGGAVSACWVACGDTNDCGPDQICDTATGACENATGGGLGTTCAGGASCTAGSMPFCLPNTSGDATYCTSGCTKDSDCGTGGVCVSNLLVGPGNTPENMCLEACASGETCASGQLCEAWDDASGASTQGCWLKCESTNDCGPSQTCTTSTGACG